jgi:hypothetical protein
VNKPASVVPPAPISRRPIRSRLRYFQAGVYLSAMAHRFLALVLLYATAVSLVEPVLGELRDGEIHHESAAAALTHAQFADGDHGHEDAGTPAHEHGREHRHGTSADHCTHQHGTAAPATVTLPFVLATAVHSATEPSVRIAWTPSLQFHPPRA